MHKELDTLLSEDSLFHWETLLVTTSHDLKDISLELISELVTTDLLSQSLVVELAAETHKIKIRQSSLESDRPPHTLLGR